MERAGERRREDRGTVSVKTRCGRMKQNRAHKKGRTSRNIQKVPMKKAPGYEVEET